MESANLRIAVAACIAFCLSLVDCRNNVLVFPTPQVDDPATIPEIHFLQHIQPILAGNCLTAGCHNSFDAAANLRLDTWEHIFQGSKSGAVIVSGNSFMSHLFHVVNSDTTMSPVSYPQMPPGRTPLSRTEILLFKRWIDEGAKNDGGRLPFESTPAGRVFATNQSSDLVAVIDIATNLVIRYISVGPQPPLQIPNAPHHVRVDSYGKFFYVTLINAQELWKFDARTYEFVTKVSVSPQPADVILTPSGDTAIVTHFDPLSQNLVTFIDTRTMEIIKSVRVPSFLRDFISRAHGALLSHDGTRLYTTNQASGNLCQIAMSDGSVTLIALDTTGCPRSNTSPYLIDESADGRFLYVSCSATNEMRVIDRNIDSSRATVIVPVGRWPLHVKVSPDGNYIITANQLSDNVSIIDAETYATTTIENVGRQPHGIEFSPDRKLMYVTCENVADAVPPHHPTVASRGISFVVVIDFASRQVIKRIEVGGFAAGISVSDDHELARTR
ncbi:MAG: beta-propeller fold lactonase family protein [Ignavibacteriae bacterium]|nr:beta-propeller fold lactonase family protein [Ignavibacteria bacterium]MBI3364599.1 beta-propeller fold lactonase family protein [Ignavibacteriota bacterium]